MKTICFGDSITKGQFSYNWVKQLSTEYKSHTFINEGVNGELSFDLLRRVDRITQAKPDVVFILVGTNDIYVTASEAGIKRYRKFAKQAELPTKELYFENLEKIILAIKPTNSKIVLITIPLLGEDLDDVANKRVAEYNGVIRSLKEKHSCDLTDLHDSMVNYLKANPPQKPVRLELSLKLVIKAILKRTFLFYSWNRISRSFGLSLTTDTIHLNETSGKMLTELTGKYLNALGEK